MAERKRACYKQKSVSLDSDTTPELYFHDPMPLTFSNTAQVRYALREPPTRSVAPNYLERVIYQTSPVPFHCASASPPTTRINRRTCFAHKSVSVDHSDPFGDRMVKFVSMLVYGAMFKF